MNAPRELDFSPAMRGEIKTPTLLLMHLHAGNSILTVSSAKTAHRYTFRFSRPDEPRPGQPKPIWVNLYGGEAQADPSRRWSFLGTIWPGKEGDDFYVYRRSAKSRVDHGHTAHRAAAWIACHLPAHVDDLMAEAQWWHEGVCGRCGRRLTVPESIATGFGPECRKVVGLDEKEGF